MVAIIDQHKFRLNFTHTQTATRCEIQRQSSVFDSEWATIAVGTAVCHKFDNFCKETGRKVSLRRALASSSYFSGPALRDTIRERRRIVWNTYHARGPRTANRVRA
jgi:hypothetical protein